MPFYHHAEGSAGDFRLDSAFAEVLQGSRVVAVAALDPSRKQSAAENLSE